VVVALALKVAVTGEAVVLVRVMAGIVVVPLVVVRPLIPAGGIQFHAMVTGLDVDDMVTAALGLLEQIVWSAIENCAVGAGFTVMEKPCAGPTQVSAVGVTITVATTGDDVGLFAVKEAMSPVPLAASPMEVVLFTQL
jgi:hypothetical protein